MAKELKDYLHLYLGCKIMITDPKDGEAKERALVGIDNTFTNPVRCINGEYVSAFDFTDVKPILRPLESMTEEERVFHSSLQARWPVTPAHRHLTCIGETPESFHWLLSKHFDLFNLIPEGLATIIN